MLPVNTNIPCSYKRCWTVYAPPLPRDNVADKHSRGTRREMRKKRENKNMSFSLHSWILFQTLYLHTGLVRTKIGSLLEPPVPALHECCMAATARTIPCPFCWVRTGTYTGHFNSKNPWYGITNQDTWYEIRNTIKIGMKEKKGENKNTFHSVKEIALNWTDSAFWLSLGCAPFLPLPTSVHLWGVHRHHTGWRLVGIALRSTLQTV